MVFEPTSGRGGGRFEEPWYLPRQQQYGYAEDLTVEYRQVPTAPLDEPAAPQLPPDPPAERAPGPDRVGLVITVVVVVVLVLCGGLVAVLRAGGNTSTAGVAASPAPATSTARASVAAGKPPAPSTADPSVIVAGQCVTNDGTPDNPKLRLVACQQGAYLVVDRFDSTDDARKCEARTGYTHDYVYQTTPTTLDFVLCLKKL